MPGRGAGLLLPPATSIDADDQPSYRTVRHSSNTSNPAFATDVAPTLHGGEDAVERRMIEQILLAFLDSGDFARGFGWTRQTIPLRL